MGYVSLPEGMARQVLIGDEICLNKSDPEYPLIPVSKRLHSS